jgi:hypothetical protein
VEWSGAGGEGWRNGVKPGPVVVPGYVEPRANGNRAHTSLARSVGGDSGSVSDKGGRNIDRKCVGGARGM